MIPANRLAFARYLFNKKDNPIKPLLVKGVYYSNNDVSLQPYIQLFLYNNANEEITKFDFHGCAISCSGAESCDS